MLRSERGFTLVEILMVVMVVGILAAVSVPQFVDFSSDAKNGATQSALGTLRSAITTQYAQMKLRCAATAGLFPTAAQVNANNITNGGVPCKAANIPVAADRKFVAGSVIPDNPWSGTKGTAARKVNQCSGATTGCSKTDATNCAGTAYAATDGGWCYNPANGDIWANSANNGLTTKEYTY